MLTRLYIDNFRCFEKFEWKPGRKQLILGRNGTGKTSLMDALQFLVELVARGERVDERFKLNQRNRWLDQREQVFELEVKLDGRNYLYKLRLEPTGDPPTFCVHDEELIAPDLHLKFTGGQLAGSQGSSPLLNLTGLDRSRSALSTSATPKEFREWIAGVSYWHINPTSMGSLVRGWDRYPQPALGNFAAWYRRLVRDQPTENTAFLQDLRESLDCFDRLNLEHAEEDYHVLYAEFLRHGSRIRMPFDELSDGQRCLICLYAIVHFVVAKGGTVVIDEPDNFISLREIQPWLMRIEEIADDNKGQVILISHHPEILNQWANPYGVQLERDGVGPVRVETFRGDPEGSLTAAEVVAGGWDFD
jgi:predicted ATPase